MGIHAEITAEALPLNVETDGYVNCYLFRHPDGTTFVAPGERKYQTLAEAEAASKASGPYPFVETRKVRTVFERSSAEVTAAQDEIAKRVEALKRAHKLRRRIHRVCDQMEAFAADLTVSHRQVTAGMPGK